MTTFEEKKDHATRIVCVLEGFQKSRGKLAELRRCVSGPDPRNSVHAHRFVVPLLPKKCSEDEERAYYMAVALWANHDTHCVPGVTLACALANAVARDPNASRRVERRFSNTIDSHIDDLMYHLKDLITLTDGGIDWAALIMDICSWSREDKGVQHRWAREFWRRRSTVETEDDSAVEAAVS